MSILHEENYKNMCSIIIKNNSKRRRAYSEKNIQTHMISTPLSVSCK